MPLQATSGAASYDAFGGGVPAAPPTYIEDVFSTYLYTGNGSTQTITNGIDLSTKGGLVWIKGRNTVEGHTLFDTARGINQLLQTQNADGSANYNNSLTAFNTTGFSLGTNRTDPSTNFASWTFRKQPKFFDVVTFTAGTSSNRRISHSLGSTPGMILLKANESRNWYVYHRSLGRGAGAYLNLTNAAFTSANTWGTSDPTSTDFGFDEAGWATSGVTQTAYLFAHDAGGFGLTGTDNVISCGSLTINGSGGSGPINLGFEPQWLLIKKSSGAGNWQIVDTMRNWSQTAGVALFPNTAGVESDAWANYLPISSTGFEIANGATGAGETWIYIAIRRGPMKVPTDATKVFAAVSRTGTDANAVVTAGFAPDFLITKNRFSSVGNGVLDRLRSLNRFLTTSDVAAEDTVQTDIIRSWNMTGLTLGPDANTSVFNWSSNTYINYMFKRAPDYFDEACYTGTGSNTTQVHNLTTVPELIFVKRRNASGAWQVYASALANTEYLVLDSTAAKATGATRWNSTTPTSSVFSLGTDATVNASGGTYIAYLFGTCSGVSKVGSFTGNGTTQTIDCGFGAGGARFVLIKRTDAAGDWYTYDTVRGMTALTDPYYFLNSGVSEVATLGSVTTVSTGFALNSAIVAAINVNAGTYIFLAIA